MIDQGFIKIYTSNINHCLYRKPLIWHLWYYCLLIASPKNMTINFNNKKILIKKNQFIINLKKLSINTGLSIQNVRTGLKTLKNHGMLESEICKLINTKTRIFTVKEIKNAI